MHDVTIVGGGMVGMSLALGLAQGLAQGLASPNLRVAVLEARDFKAVEYSPLDQRTTAVAAGTQKILAGLGLWQTLQAHASPIKRIHVSEKSRFGSTQLDSADYALDALGYVIDNQQFMQAALAQLASTDVELISPCTVTSVTAHDSDGYTLETDQGQIETKLLVIADGVNSATCQMLGLQHQRHAYQQQALTFNVATSKPHQGRAFERFTPHGPLAFLPLNDGLSSVVWCLPDTKVDTVAALDNEAFLSLLQLEFGHRLGEITRCGARGRFPLSLYQAEAHVGDNLVILGNAAHNLHPVAGQGFNLSMRDVGMLVDLLRQDGTADLSTLLATFHTGRQRDQALVIKATDTLVRLFSNALLPQMAVRHAGLMALDYLPLAKRLLAEQSMGLRGKQSAVALATKGV